LGNFRFQISNFRLKNMAADTRVALVTGGGRGIGEAIAVAFARAGTRVALAARTEGNVRRVAEAIRADGGVALPVTCDVTQTGDVARMVESVQRELGNISILVNNAGAAASHKFVGHDDALWQRMIDANLNSVYHVSKAVVPMMVAARWGRIINIASIAAKVGGKYIAAYTAAKHGVLGLTRALAVELVGHNITVNAICPGYVDTPMTEQSIANMVARTEMSEAEARAFLERQSPQNRLFAPEEVAHVALMLAGENARGITGQAINVDGGQVQS
jgi:NAD(P)-dependent dehydrogenase (short-subunit alcohol dehydrogenase family)